MFVQIALGSGLLLSSILIAALSAILMEIAFSWGHEWLLQEPHRPKLVILIAGVSVWVLGVTTAGVWLWIDPDRALWVFVAVLVMGIFFWILDWILGSVTAALAGRGG